MTATEIYSGKTYRYRIIVVNFDMQGAVPVLNFVVAQGTVDSEDVFHEVSRQTINISPEDVVVLMTAAPIQGLSRREDMLQAWSQFFIDRGLIEGVLVPSIP